MPRYKDGGLSPKEKLFVGQMVKNKGNRTESAMIVYDTKRRENARQIGKRVASKPNVREAIDKALESHGLTASYLIEKEKEIIDKGLKYGKYTVSDARLSIQNLHKLHNNYPERVNKNMNLNINKDINNSDTPQILKTLKEVQQTTEQLLQDINKK